MTDVPRIALRDGHTIPQLGFGVFQVPPEDTAQAVSQALEAGYRHIDTAQMYGNEAGVGEAVAASGIPREELFITSKLNNGFHRPDDAKRSFEESLTRLGLDYLDLFLIHWPLPTRYDGDYVSTWETMLSFAEDGRSRSVGVSNFQPDHLQRIIDATGTPPAVNQIEVHPYFSNNEVRRAGFQHQIIVEAWSPIAQGKVLGDETLEEIARTHGKTSAQVALRWHLERGDVIFPKSVTPERIRENLDILDFSLSPEEVKKIDTLDRGEDGRVGPHPDRMDYIPE